MMRTGKVFGSFLLITVIMAICQPGVLQAAGEQAKTECQNVRKIVSTDQPIMAQLGGVSCEHPLAAQAGLEILQKGGNAVDAMIATGLAMCVVDHGYNGLGGYGGCMVIYLRDRKEPIVVDFTTRAIKAATNGMFYHKAYDKDYMIKSISTWNVVAGLYTALQEYGTMKWSEVIQPAIRCAEEGFIISPDYAYELGEAYKVRLQYWPGSVAIFGRSEGGPLQAGDRLVQKDLAQSLRILAEEGPDAIYTGNLAKTMVDYIQSQGGLITMEDLADWRSRLVRILKPAHTNYRGYDIYTPPICTGGENLIEILNILKGFDLPKMGFCSQSVHLILEACKLGYADRFAYVADPWMEKVPYVGLMSQKYADERRQLIKPDAIIPQGLPGDPRPYDTAGPEAYLPEAKSTVDDGKGTPAGEITASPRRAEKETSTASSATIDSRGNMVAMTMTLRAIMGSGVTVPGTGIVLADGMPLFHPVGDEAMIENHPNRLEPNKLAVNNMNPFIILSEGVPFMTGGAAGGRNITTECLEAIVGVIDWGMSLQEAVSRPRFHVEDKEPCLLEENFPYGIGKELEAMGHKFANFYLWGVVQNRWGSLHAIMVDPQTGDYYIARESRVARSAAGGLITDK